MVANILSADPLTLGVGSKFNYKIFKSVVMLHIKFKRITYAATWYQIFCVQTPSHPTNPPPPPRRWGWDQNPTISEHGHVAYQIKYNQECNNMVANILPPDPPSTTGFKRSNFKISEHGHVAYPIKWNHECNHMVTHILYAEPPPSTLGVKRSKF